MRRLLCILLIVVILCCFIGCGQQPKTTSTAVNFYYCKEDITFDGDNNVFVAEQRASANTEDLVSVMNEHLQGPESDNLYNPYPTTCQILSIKKVGTTLTVNFSVELSRLTGPDLMLACVCTAMTLFDMTQAETVIITAEGVMLDGKESVMLTPDRLVFADTQPPETTEQ